LYDIDDRERLDLRLIGDVKVKGKVKPVILYEVYNGDSMEIKTL
jgi:hypothetical protein